MFHHRLPQEQLLKEFSKLNLFHSFGGLCLPERFFKVNVQNDKNKNLHPDNNSMVELSH